LKYINVIFILYTVYGIIVLVIVRVVKERKKGVEEIVINNWMKLKKLK
jgi:hypothetical protein